tara:strand:+ start:808 stop:975 length:168 start_codon:yes stop_codon:yes gene_type:complete
MQDVYEQYFLLQYHTNWSFIEWYSLPIGLRKWFFERLIRQKEEEAEARQSASRSK